MRQLTEQQQLELAAMQSILRRIRLVMSVYGREFEDVIGALYYLDGAEFEYPEQALRPMTDACTERDALRQDREQMLANAQQWLGYLLDAMEAAAERFSQQLDRPLKENLCRDRQSQAAQYSRRGS